MPEQSPPYPDGTTAEFIRYARWSAQLTEKDHRLIKAGDPQAPTFPPPDGTTAAFVQYVQKEAERVRQWIAFFSSNS